MSEKLTLIYENIDVLVAKESYMVLPNETPRFFKALVVAGIATYDQLMAAWEILTHKHDEKNPFPSHERLMTAFRVKKRAITGTISAFLKTGLFINEKGKYGTDKRKNTYNVTPFLNLLGLFIEKEREGVEFDITELYNGVISGDMAARKTTEKKQKKEAPKVELSEAIVEALNAVEDKEQREILETNIIKHIKRLDEETLIYYIDRVLEKFDSSKGKFSSAAYTFYNGANNGDKEKHKQLDAQRYKGNTSDSRKSKTVRKEHTPEWLEEQQEANAKRDKVSPTQQRENEKHNEMVNEAVINGLKEAFEVEKGKNADENGNDYARWKMDLFMNLPQDMIAKYGQNELCMYNFLYPNSVKEFKKVV
ncbi:hypothetical protein [Priestia megaterium]|uniref:hypothetical protein n=1 Tax=Priestia megaterium TaxID=1404 RepID=UPI000BF32876|nr:hypothetical protein [Priestia megaterium]PFW43787.1 hypothetical protein COL17_26630 [Priestia megaterium]